MLRFLMETLYIHHCCTNAIIESETNEQETGRVSSLKLSAQEPTDVDEEPSGVAAASSFLGFHDLASEEWVRTKVIPNSIFILLSRKAALLGKHGWNISIPSTATTNQVGLVFHRSIQQGKWYESSDSDMILGCHDMESWTSPPVFLDVCRSTAMSYIPLHVSLLLDFIELTCSLFRYTGINIAEDSEWLNVLKTALGVSSYVLIEEEDGSAVNGDDDDDDDNAGDIDLIPFGIPLHLQTSLCESDGGSAAAGKGVLLEKYACGFSAPITLEYFIFHGGLDAIQLCLEEMPFQDPDGTAHGSQSAKTDRMVTDLVMDQTNALPEDSRYDGSAQQRLPRPSLFCYSSVLDLFDQKILPYILTKRNSCINEAYDTSLLTAMTYCHGFYEFLRSITPDVDINGTSDRTLFLSMLHDLHNTGIMLSAGAHGTALQKSDAAASASTAPSSSGVAHVKWSFLLEYPDRTLRSSTRVDPHEACMKGRNRDATHTTTADPSTFALLLRLEGIYKMIKSSAIQNKIAGIMELRVVIDNVEAESKNHSKGHERAPQLRDQQQLYHGRDRLPTNHTTSPTIQVNASSHPVREKSLVLSSPSPAGPLPAVKGQWQLRQFPSSPVVRDWNAVPSSFPADLSPAQYSVGASSSDDADVVVDHMSNNSENITGPTQDLFFLYKKIKHPFDRAMYEDTDEGSTKACCSDDEIRDDATASDDEILELMSPDAPFTPPSGPTLLKRPPNTEILHSKSKTLARPQRETEERLGNDGKSGLSFKALFDTELGNTEIEMGENPCDKVNPSADFDEADCSTESSKTPVIVSGDGTRVATTKSTDEDDQSEKNEDEKRLILCNEVFSDMPDEAGQKSVSSGKMNPSAPVDEDDCLAESLTAPVETDRGGAKLTTTKSQVIPTDVTDLSRVSDCIDRAKLLLEDQEYDEAYFSVLLGIEVLEEFRNLFLGDSFLSSFFHAMRSELVTLKKMATEGILKEGLANQFTDIHGSDRFQVVEKIQTYVCMLPDESTPVDNTNGSLKETNTSLRLAFERQRSNSATTSAAVKNVAVDKNSSRALSETPSLVLRGENTREDATTDHPTSGSLTHHYNISTLLDFLLSPRRVLLQMTAPAFYSHVQSNTDNRSMLQLLTSPEYLHPQLLKRFLHILHFLAGYHCIVPPDLHSLWDAAIHPPSNQHESIQKTLIYDTWIPLLRGSKLNVDQLLHLYGEINNALFTTPPTGATESEPKISYSAAFETNAYSVEDPKSANVISIDLMIPVVLTFADATFGVIVMTKPQSSDATTFQGSDEEDIVMTPVGLDLLWRLANEVSLELKKVKW